MKPLDLRFTASSSTPETDKLGRAADRAVWSADVAESVRELVLAAIDAAPPRETRDELRRRIDRSLVELVEK